MGFFPVVVVSFGFSAIILGVFEENRFLIRVGTLLMVVGFILLMIGI